MSCFVSTKAVALQQGLVLAEMDGGLPEFPQLW